MARNKDFFVNSAPKRDKSFFVKEDTATKKENINIDFKPANLTDFVSGVRNKTIVAPAKTSQPIAPANLGEAYLHRANMTTEDIRKQNQESTEWRQKSLPEKIGTGVGKAVATPVAAFAQLGTGAAQGLEGAMDFGTSAGVTGINAARDRRIQTIEKEIARLKAQGKGDSSIVKALEEEREKARSAIEQSNKTAEEFVGKQWVQDYVGNSVDEFTDKYSYLPEKAGQITKTVGNMLPSIANAGSIAKSLPQATTKLGQLATKTATMLPFMAQAAGSSTEQALNEGANLQEATKYGLASGVLEGTIESISGGIGGSIGGKVLSSRIGKEAAERIAKNALGKFALKLADAGIDVAGEGFEEVLSTAINPYIQRMTYDEKAKLATSEEMMQSFIDGVLASLLVKGGQAGLSRVTNRNNANVQENEALNQVQSQETNQTNTITPTQAETVQNVNMEQIAQNPNLPTQKAQETLQSAKIAGMTDMDIQKAKELNDMLRSGTRLKFYDPQNIPQGVDVSRAADANGFYADGTLWINKNSEMKVERILGHELTHHVENDDLINTILDSNIFYDFLSEKGFSNTAEFKKYLMEKKGYRQEELTSEMVAHFAEEKLFGKEETINRLARENRTLAQKILNWISDLRIKIAGSTEAKELLKIENMYRKALDQARNTAYNTTDVKYNIKNIAEFDENEYNNIQEMKLSPKEYGKLAHIVDTDPSIKPGLNRVTTSDATYVIYQKEYNDFKVVDKYEGGVDNDTIANGNIRGIDNARNGRSRLQVPIENTRNEGATKSNDELLNGNKGARSVKIESNRNGISNNKSVAGKEPAFSMPETDNVIVKNEITNTYGDETYNVMTAELDGRIIGKIEYGVYNGTPHIQMIETKPEYRRKGVATKLLQELQKQYKNKEIDFGMTTPDGTKLLENITYLVENKKVTKKLNRIKEIDKIINEYDKQLGYYEENGMRVPEGYADDYNELIDEKRMLEDETYDKEPNQRFIRYSMNQTKGGKKTTSTKALSTYAQTLQSKHQNIPEQVNLIQKEVDNGNFMHEVVHDKRALNYAEKYIAENGFEDAVKHWDELMKRGKAVDKDELALGQTIYNIAVDNKDTRLVMKMASDLVQEYTEIGRNLQSATLLRKMTPDGRLYALERSVQKINQDLMQNFDDFENIKIPEELADNLLRSETQKEMDKAVEQIQEYIASQIPATWQEKLNSWRYLAMLGNPRTHIRNIVGNAVFIPAVEMKNVLAQVGELAISKDQRTKAFLGKKDAKLLKYAENDFDKNQETIRGENKYDIKSGVQEKRTIYSNGAIEAARKGNFKLLEAEDTLFLKYRYKKAFAAALKARGITIEQLRENSPETVRKVNEIRSYAINEAQKATYRDASLVASMVSRGKRKLLNAANQSQGAAKLGYNLAYLGAEGVMPFAKTPINIVKRGIEYSPAGLLNGVKNAIFDVKSGKVTAAQAIDKIAAGATGTSIAALGLLLASMGLVSGGEEDKEKEQALKQLKGYQDYSLNVLGKSYTIDWTAPSSIPLFIGVELYNSINSEDESAFLNALSNLAEPVVEMSMLQGLNDTLTTLGEDSALGNIVGKTLTNYLGQYNPTILGQIARSFDPVRRTTYVDKNIPVPAAAQRFIQQQAAKIPGVSRMLPTYKDQLGQEQLTDGVINRIVQNFFSPGYLKDIKEGTVEQGLTELYEKTGETSVIPSYASKTLTHNGEKINLTAKQYDTYAKTRGDLSKKGLEGLFKDNYYKSLSDEQKVKVVEAIYDYAGNIAKTKVIDDYELEFNDKKIQKLQNEGLDFYKYILLKKTADADGNDYTSNDELDKAIKKYGLSRWQKTIKEKNTKSTKATNTLPTLSSQRAKLPTLKK